MTQLPRSCVLIAAGLLLGVGASATAADPLDWPSWRGPEQNRISRETNLVDDLDPRGESLLWKNEELAGRSTPIVMRGKLYTIVRAEPDTPREGERVVCADAATGNILWENRFNVYLSDVPDTRVGWSCCVGDPETGRVYVLGVCGHFLCIDGETGETVWERSLVEEFGMLTTYGGRTNIPVVFEDMVLISGVLINWGEEARPKHSFIAMDKQTGDVVWLNGTTPLPDDTTYSTPYVGVLNGQAAMVFGAGDGGVWAFQPRTGQPIWHYRFSRRGINNSPLVDGDRVYIGQGEENIDDTTMGAVAAIDGSGSGDITESGTIWRLKEIVAGRSTPLLVNGRLYLVDDKGGLWTFNPETGEELDRRMKLDTVMFPSMVYGDGKFYVTTANGRWYVLRPDGDKIGRISFGRFPSGEDCQGSPIISHGRIFVPTSGAMYCFGKKDHQPSGTPQPNLPQETPVDSDQEPAHVQVVPADLLLKPGEEQQFTARVFNSRGQLLAERSVEFGLEGSGGRIDSQGVFVADPDSRHVATTVVARLGDLSGKARVRIVPDLSWEFDFSDGQVPITWIGARYRHVIRDEDGNPLLVKVTTIPKGTRSRAFMGHSHHHDYTIEADVRGAAIGGKMPDIGLIAQRYTMDLMGAHQQLQIRTWDAQLRMARTVPFEWQPDVWYRMKLRAAVEGGQAVLRGKVWPRDQAEPDSWTIEAVDDVPNLTGSPGLYGNAKDAEIFLDNIRVTPNES